MFLCPVRDDVGNSDALIQKVINGRQNHRTQLYAEFRQPIFEKLDLIGGRCRTVGKLTLHRPEIFQIARSIAFFQQCKLTIVLADVVGEHHGVVGIVPAEQLQQHGELFRFRQLLDPSQQVQHRTVGIFVHRSGKFLSRQAQFRQLFFRTTRLHHRHRSNHALHCLRREFGGFTHTQEGAAQCRTLVFRHTQLLDVTADTGQDVDNIRRFGVCIVRKVVDGVTQYADFRNRYLQDVGQCRHRFACLSCRHIECHPHFGGIFGKARQVFPSNSGLPTCGNDGSNFLARHRNLAGHFQNVPFHLLELLRCIEIDHLFHIRHCRFKFNRHLDGQNQSTCGNKCALPLPFNVCPLVADSCSLGTDSIELFILAGQLSNGMTDSFVFLP